MQLALLATASVIICCVFLNRLFERMGMPMLLVFIGLGMAFGVDGVLKIDFEDYALTEQAATVALIFIMFYGGFCTRWRTARPTFGKAALLASAGVAATALLTCAFCHFCLQMNFLESLLIGSVLSSTDAASVFSILRSKQLGLKYNTTSLLELESGSNDPCSYMLTALTLTLLSGTAAAGQVLYMLFAQIAFALLVGALVAWCALAAVKYLQRRGGTDGFDAIIVFAAALMSYSLPAYMGGNGYLSAYIVGIVMGNARIDNKRAIVHFLDGTVGLMQMTLFFLLGLLATPSKLPEVFPTALAIGLFITFVARPAAVFALLAPLRCPWRQQVLVAWAGLRGAASIVFAIMALMSPAYIKDDLFHIVFCIVLLSITFQGSLIPWASKKLGMIDHNIDVLRTFTDYQEEREVQFIRLSIGSAHPWKDRMIKELPLPPDILIAVLIRDGTTLIPSGSTVLHEGDTAVLSAPAYRDETSLQLREHRVERGSKWSGSTISEFSPNPGDLVIMIRRGTATLIPRGQTVIMDDDVLVLCSSIGSHR